MAQSRSYGEKLRIVDRDAVKAVVALCVVIVVWLVCGFGLAGTCIVVFHTPLWVVAGLLGTWIAAIVAVAVLSRLFVDFDLEEEEAGAHSGTSSEARSETEAYSEENAEAVAVISNEEAHAYPNVEADGVPPAVSRYQANDVVRGGEIRG